MALDPAVEALVADGRLARLDLIRFDLPGIDPVGYHRGGRPYTYNGIVYKPNRWLSQAGYSSALGVAVTTRTIIFSNIPTTDVDDAIAQLETYDYPNAYCIITTLAGNPDTDQVVGELASSLYQIDKVRYTKSATDASGARSLNIQIDLQPPGRSARGSTLIKRSQTEHQFDNDATDTCLEYVATTGTVPEEWGQSG